MKREYHGIYQLLYNEYENYNYQDTIFRRNIFLESRTSEFARVSAELRKMIDEEISNNKLGNRIRNDSKYFLLLNFHQMFIIPLLLNDNVFQGITNEYKNSFETMRNDIRMILSYASKSANEITSHSILLAINELWKELKISSYDVWG